MSNKVLRIPDLIKKAAKQEKLVMVTAYDYFTALIADSCGVDMILVGDSLGTVVLGYESTVAVTLEDILHHTRPVVRGTKRAMVIADMPFGTFQTSTEAALKAAVSLVKYGGAAAVKLEGGLEVAETVRAITKAGIPVMGHIGLLPQTAPLWDGYHIQGRDEESVLKLTEAALALEEAGAFALVLECVAKEAAKYISQKVKIPTIGIGSGPYCHGQVLVGQDLFGMNTGHVPSFVKKYGDVAAEMKKAFEAFLAEVKEGAYPQEAHSYSMEENEAEKLL